MNNQNVLNSISALIDTMLNKIDNDKDLLFLKRELSLVKSRVANTEDSTKLDLHAKAMARQVYDNFWDTKDIYYDFVELDKLQGKLLMTNSETKLINTVSEKLGIHPENFRGIFNIEVVDNQIACSSEIFVNQNDKYVNVQSQMTDEHWFKFLKEISEPLVQIYKNKEFTYLVFKCDSEKPSFSYEKNSSMTISNRFILWEYDEFGIGDRKIPLYKRVLDKYRPLD